MIKKIINISGLSNAQNHVYCLSIPCVSPSTIVTRPPAVGFAGVADEE
jgi:hypothetical protein